jgi:hypothetical protein
LTTDDGQIVPVVIGKLSNDGDSLIVQLALGGAEPADPATNNYQARINFTAVRAPGGAITVPAVESVTNGNGAAPSLTPGVSGDDVILTFAVPGVDGYRHSMVRDTQLLPAS